MIFSLRTTVWIYKRKIGEMRKLSFLYSSTIDQIMEYV